MKLLRMMAVGTQTCEPHEGNDRVRSEGSEAKGKKKKKKKNNKQLMDHGKDGIFVQDIKRLFDGTPQVGKDAFERAVTDDERTTDTGSVPIF